MTQMDHRVAENFRAKILDQGQGQQVVVAILCVSLVTLVLKWVTQTGASAGKLRLPPGPRGWPVLGALPHLNGIRHQVLHRLSEKYGPLMFMYLGSLPTVVVSNADMAKEVFKTHDRHMASRPDFAITSGLYYNKRDLTFAPYGAHWRKARRICVAKLLIASRIHHFREKRQEEVQTMVQSILMDSQNGQTVQMDKRFGEMTMNITTQLLWSKSHRGAKRTRSADNPADDGEEKVFVDLFHEKSKLLGANNIGDFIPVLSRLSMELQGFSKRVAILHHNMDRFLSNILDEHKKPTRRKRPSLVRMPSGVVEEVPPNGDADDFVDVLLKLCSHPDPNERISEDTVKGILMDMITGGTETAAVTLEWALAELLRHPDLMRRAQDELRWVVGFDRLVNEGDLPELTYLNAVVKETMRLHPAGPLGSPHFSTADCEINGFHLPTGSLIFANIWAIQRDPAMWSRPLQFDPDRFLDSKGSADVDYRGQDFHLIPFGAGRRICPAINLASIVVQLALAQVLHAIDWSLPDDQKPEDMDMSEAGGGLDATKAVPLTVLAKARLPHEVIF